MTDNKVKDVIWWEPSVAGEVIDHRKLLELSRSVDAAHATRRAMNVHHLRLYADRDLPGSYGASWRRDSLSSRVGMFAAARQKPKLSVNVVRNMVNAATSMICRSRPRPQFLTSGGDFDLQQKAKRRTQFSDAILHAENTYTLGAKAVQHAHCLGTGAVKILRDYDAKKVRHEVAFIGELLVDETEGVNGTPRNYFHVRAVDRLVAKATYGNMPDFDESAIDRAQPANALSGRGDTTDQILIVEGWHLPSSEGAGDGRYGVITDAGTLFATEYKWQSPPFAFYRWEDDPLGFYGTGIPSELAGVQYEINETIRNIQANWWAGGNLKVLVERGSKVVKAHLNNDLRGTIVEYTGRPPVWMTTDAVSGGLVQYLQMLIDYAYQVTGISQLSAQQQTPAASMSGRARLVHENSESLRFLPAQRRHEQFYLDIARRTMEAAADLYEEVGDFEVIYPGKEFLDPIKYSEIAAGDDVYDIQCYPTSILPATPAGKLDFVEALEARGYIDKTQATKLLEFPDLRREMDLDLASVDVIDFRLSQIMLGKEYIPPTPEMDLMLALKRSLNAILLSENRNVPEERIELLRKWRDTVQEYLNQAAPPAPPGPPGAGGPPTGPGFPAPAEMPPNVPVVGPAVATTEAA